MAGIPFAAVALATLLAVGAGSLGPGRVPAGGPVAAEYPPPSAAAPSTAARLVYRWPLAGRPGVVHPFGPGPWPWSPGHRGVDLEGAAAGVLAAGPGVVAFAGVVAGRGVVSVRHPDGLRTTYEPVRASVRAGQAVVAGTLLGQLEPTGSHCSPVACLHWGAIGGTGYLDPLSLLRPTGPVVLLPVS